MALRGKGLALPLREYQRHFIGSPDRMQAIRAIFAGRRGVTDVDSDWNENAKHTKRLKLDPRLERAKVYNLQCHSGASG